MWLEILVNVSLSMIVMVGSIQFSSAIAEKFKLNSVVEKALVVILIAAGGYVGFLVAWLSYLVNSNSPIITLRILLIAGLLHLVQKRRFTSEQIHLIFLCFVATLVAAAMAMCRGIADSTQGLQHTLAVRYWNSVDNKIPGLFASALQRKIQLRPTLLNEWQSSDRPPIATGLVRVLSPLTHTPEPDFFVIIACSSVLIIAVMMLVEVLWNLRNLAYIISVSAYFAPGIFVNVVYTWPKIIAASLTLVAVVLLLQLKKEPNSNQPYFFLACLSIILSLLAHGSSAFVVPAFLLLAISVTRNFYLVTKTFLLSLLMYLPWYGYQQLWDPPGNRLVYWHLAGELGGGDISIVRTIIDRYQDLGVSQIVNNKLQNFQALFTQVEGNPAVSGYGSSLGNYRQLTSETVFGAIGVLGLLGLVIFICAGLRRSSQRPDDFLKFLLFSAVTFCLLEFGDSFSTRASLVVSPMVISVGLAVVGLGSISVWLGFNQKWIIILSLPNIAIFGPMQSTAAAAGWNLWSWDSGTCVLLGIALSIMVLYLIRLPEHNQTISVKR